MCRDVCLPNDGADGYASKGTPDGWKSEMRRHDEEATLSLIHV